MAGEHEAAPYGHHERGTRWAVAQDRARSTARARRTGQQALTGVDPVTQQPGEQQAGSEVQQAGLDAADVHRRQPQQRERREHHQPAALASDEVGGQRAHLTGTSNAVWYSSNFDTRTVT